jgi:hypothetical protein
MGLWCWLGMAGCRRTVVPMPLQRRASTSAAPSPASLLVHTWIHADSEALKQRIALEQAKAGELEGLLAVARAEQVATAGAGLATLGVLLVGSVPGLVTVAHTAAPCCSCHLLDRRTYVCLPAVRSKAVLPVILLGLSSIAVRQSCPISKQGAVC